MTAPPVGIGPRRKTAPDADGQMERDRWPRRATIIAGDMSHSHVLNAYSVAEMLSAQMPVELLAFRFADDDGQTLFDRAPFKTKSFRGCDFPDFFGEMAKALSTVRGNFLYVLGAQLPSLGLALMANYHRGAQIALETEDVSTEGPVGPKEDALLNPRSQMWSEVLRPLASELPILFMSGHGTQARSRSQATLENLGLEVKRLNDKRLTYEVSQRFAQKLASFHETIVRS